MARAEVAARALLDMWEVPFLCTAMGRGLVADTHPCCVNAARSTALAQADVAVVVGARCVVVCVLCVLGCAATAVGVLCCDCCCCMCSCVVLLLCGVQV